MCVRVWLNAIALCVSALTVHWVKWGEVEKRQLRTKGGGRRLFVNVPMASSQFATRRGTSALCKDSCSLTLMVFKWVAWVQKWITARAENCCLLSRGTFKTIVARFQFASENNKLNWNTALSQGGGCKDKDRQRDRERQRDKETNCQSARAKSKRILQLF